MRSLIKILKGKPPSGSSIPVNRTTSRNVVNTHGPVNSEERQLEAQGPDIPETRRAKLDNKAECQPTPFGENVNPDQYPPTDQRESTINNISAPPTAVVDTTHTTKTKSESKTEDKTDIEQIPLESKRKYICASCELDPKIIDIVESNKMTSCFFCNSSAEMQKLLKRVKSSERNTVGLEKTVKEQNKNIETLQKALKRKEDETSRLKEKIKAQTRELGSLETDYEKMKADYQKNETEIRKLQQTESAMRRQGDVLMDEQAKTLILDILRTKIKAISRIYLKNVRWANILKANDDQDLKRVLGSAFSPAWHPDSWPLVRGHPDLSTQTLVTSLLSCTVSKLYFQDPFFRCGEAKDTLNKIYWAAIFKSPEPAIIWRAKTTTLLNDLSYDKGLTTTAASDIVIKRMYNSIEELIQTDNLPSGGEMNGLYNKIIDLVQSSIKLATDWHSREFHFEVISFDWLHFMEFGVYSEESARYVTPFPTSRKYEEGKRHRILAVISPGFVRYLKGDGEKDFKEIIWAKALVLLSETSM
ncbi:uncharacterized protein DFL_007626 [Arthrobotrys flagrans]|uniref:Uncharacterized protein n=1 Tax=Arthrobotrys flagrans TaxID=97331 RepID=A0A436ZWA9_ARTFL|nr:hypothetical protein DFL_007626 [Arthrobotrys flagrans]